MILTKAQRDELRAVVAEERTELHPAARHVMHALLHDLDAAERDAEALRSKAEQFRAVLWLLAEETAFVRTAEGVGVATVEHVEGEDPQVYLSCGDTFAYAFADAEPVSYAEAPEVVRLGVTEGWPGVIRWIAAKRAAAGTPEQPIQSARTYMLQVDSLREERDRMAAALRAIVAACADTNRPDIETTLRLAQEGLGSEK